MDTKHKIKKDLFLKYLCLHLNVHTAWLAVRIHFEAFFGEIDPDLLSYDPAFFKCNDR